MKLSELFESKTENAKTAVKFLRKKADRRNRKNSTTDELTTSRDDGMPGYAPGEYSITDGMNNP